MRTSAFTERRGERLCCSICTFQHSNRAKANVVPLQVSDQWAKDWCAAKGGYRYFETSAKDGRGVDEAFDCIVNMAFEYHPEEMDTYFKLEPGLSQL
ncbi:hypothetical protein HPP92_023629 [Vanilla planifolia]|uniref:Uncharacterized protein n=1 Tax=Vanilla planifolia TaxID=51239 RepID=A0A835PKY2_VANPL|nr:hypothetical protein HPP92_023629 [Vanilla planifolia]